MVGANGPVRGPHPVRASGKSVKDDSSPVRGPHPIRASEQEKEIQGGMVGKEESGATARVAGVRKRVILRRPALKPYRIFLSTYQIRCALRALNEAALLATIWNLRRATNIHGDIFVSKAHARE